MDRVTKTVIGVLIVLVVALVVGLVVSVVNGYDRAIECASKGGVMVRSIDDRVCIKAEVIK